MIQTILTCVDGSKASEQAVELSVRLAVALGASIRALHVVDTKVLLLPALQDLGGTIGIVPHGAWASDVRASLEKVGAELVEQVRARCEERGVRCQPVVREGWPQRMILAEMAHADLAVLGRTGVRQDDLRETTGHVAYHVLRRGTVARLIVHAAAPLPARVAVAFDDSTASQAALHAAAELAQRMRWPLEVLHARQKPEAGDVLAAARQYLGTWTDLDVAYRELAGAPFATLAEAMRARPDALLALGARGQHRLADWLLGTITESFHFHAATHLLVAG